MKKLRKILIIISLIPTIFTTAPLQTKAEGLNFKNGIVVNEGESGDNDYIEQIQEQATNIANVISQVNDSIKNTVSNWSIIKSWTTEKPKYKVSSKKNGKTSILKDEKVVTATNEEQILKEQELTRWEKIVKAIYEFEDIIRLVTNFLFGFAVLTSLLCLVLVILKFANSGGNATTRKEAIMDLGICALCTALLGSVKLFSSVIIKMALL